MPQVKRKPLLRYGFAVLMVALAATLTWAFPLLGQRIPFALFYVAVLLSTWYSGKWPGLLATALSAFLSGLLFLPPTLSLKVGLEEVLLLGVFLFVSLVINYLTEKAQRAETKERAIREQLLTTLRSIGDAVIATDSQGRVTFMNEVAQELTGWTHGEAEGRELPEVFRIVNEETREVVENPAAKVLREGVVVGLANHTVLIAKDGREIPIDDSGAPIRDGDRNIVGVVLVFRDIAERRQAQEVRLKLASIVESSEDAIIGKTLEGIITSWNASAERLYGYSAEEALARPISMLVPPDRPDELPNILRRLKQGERIQQFETMLVRKDGELLDVSLTISPIKNNAGAVTGASTIARDITSSMRIRRALRESEERLTQALEASRMGTWEWNIETGVITWSETLEPLHGLQPGTFAGTFEAFDELIHPEDRGLLRQAVSRAIEERTDYNIEFRIVWPDGSVHWIGGRGRAFQDETGKAVRMTGLAMDITDRKQAEDALRAGEERYRAFVQNSSEAIWRFELEEPVSVDLPEDEQIEFCYQYGYLAECNDAMAAMYGFSSAGEIVGARLGDLLVREDEKNVEYLRAFIRSGYRLTEAESHELDRDGQPLYFLNNLVGIIEGRKLLRAWGTQRDITERHLSETALRESESRFRRVVESNIIGVSFSTLDGAITDANDAYLQMLGCTRAELRAGLVRWDELTPPEYRHLDERAIAEIRRSGACTPFEKEHLRRDGTRVPVLIGSARLDETSKGCVCFIVDLTEQKRAANRTARLQAITAALSEALTPAQAASAVLTQGLNAVGAHAGSVALMTDHGGELELLDAVGFPSEMIEKWRRFPVTSEAPLAEATRTGEMVLIESLQARESRYPRLSSLHAVNDSQALAAVPLIVEGRTIGAMGMTFREVQKFETDDRAFMLAIARQCAQAIERARLYQAERRLRAEAEEANRTKDEFLATLSHELRTPLTAMLGWTRMLRMKELDEQTSAHALETVERNAKVQAQLIEDLLDVSRIITGKLRLDVRPIELLPVIEAAMDAVRPAADAKSIKLQTQLDPLAGPVSGDPSRLQQVVWNLLANAVKFTNKGGRVEVRLERVDSHVELTVRDTGQGIAPDFLPYVFDRFRQADGSTTRLHGGLGLGLAIVRHLVELHGGTVRAESAGSEQGATFNVQLPLARLRNAEFGLRIDEKANEQSAINNPQSVILEGLRVLVVDDEQDARALIQAVLETQGAEVVAAGSAREALAAFETFKPDVLVSDIGMPDEDGYALIRQVRARGPARGGGIPAAAVSAYVGEDNRRQALAAGFQLHVAKPVDPAELIAVVQNLAEGGKRKAEGSRQ
jgi:PAS domain S-box-containing protein